MKEKIKAVFFDIDDTLYDSSLQASLARRNAVKAMIEAGLEISEEDAISELNRIVLRFGSNHQKHFDELLAEFKYKSNPRIVAAGVAAYHATKNAYLVPFPDTVPTLLKLRGKGYKIGVITDGIAVKQWEKLIKLGLQHFFDAVVISSEAGIDKPDPGLFRLAAERIGCLPEEAMAVGDRLDRDIRGANLAGMVSVQVMKGKYKNRMPEDADEEPDYVVSKVSELLEFL